ncbi:condensation domain-containing protein [Nonomuraea sp. NPDC050680]|uniref:condensation domain-containing protein n=1 Tax=Nonomuraea sp. NPDC050680 TaxID=3154630 RepID=UPI0033FE75C4
MSEPSEGATLPNSDAQRTRMSGEGSCLTAAIEISGPADEDLLRARLARLVARRPALRSVFGSATGHRVLDGGTSAFTRHRVDGAGREARWALAYELARQEATRPFPVGASPLVRAALFTAEADRHLLVVSADQLVCDAWSANLLVEDFLAADLDQAPDAYPDVWRGRQEWLDGPDGLAAVGRRRQAVMGAHRAWPLSGRPDDGDPDELVERLLEIDDETTLELRRRVRQAKGSLLAVGAAALALGAVGHVTQSLALSTMFAARETEAEANVVGWLSNDALLVLPPQRGTVLDYLTAIRGEIFAALRDQRVPAERLASALHPQSGDAGLSFALLYLPAQLSGGGQVAMQLGAAEAARAAVSICPTGTDVDLFMVEDPPPRADGARPLLRLGATSTRGRAGTRETERLLSRWGDALAVLAGHDWSTTPMREIASVLAAAPGGR